MGNELVSVVIPCYRQAHYLPTAIESVLAQTYHEVEVIVVNDGSDDNTDEVASRYASRIRCVKKTNGGLSSARNAGVAAATGSHLMFLDADDYLGPDTVQLLAAAIRDQDDVPVVGYALFNEYGIYKIVSFPVAESPILPNLLYGNPIPCHAPLVPRERVLKVGGFAECLRSHEDWDLWLRLGADGMRFRPVDYIGAYYRRLAGSMSSDEQRMLDTSAQTLARFTNCILEREIFDPELLTHLVRSMRIKLRHCLVHAPNAEGTTRLATQLTDLVQYREVEIHTFYRFCYRLLGASRIEQMWLRTLPLRSKWLASAYLGTNPYKQH